MIDPISGEEPLLDSTELSKWEFVARSVVVKFPGATLEVQEVQADKAFEIIFQRECLLILDKRGVRYFFPSRRKRSVYWEKVNTNGLPRVIYYILRDLAEANFTVLSITDKSISKRPMHVSRYTRCPECKQSGGIKTVVREDSSLLEAPDLYTPIAISPETKGAELKCTFCGWLGVLEELAQAQVRAVATDSAPIGDLSKPSDQFSHYKKVVKRDLCQLRKRLRSREFIS